MAILLFLQTLQSTLFTYVIPFSVNSLASMIPEQPQLLKVASFTLFPMLLLAVSMLDIKKEHTRARVKKSFDKSFDLSR